MSGYFGIGSENLKTEHNLGTLWRSAHILGAQFIFTIGRRYKKQCADTTKAWRQLPLFEYETFEDFYKNLPRDCQLIGVEITEKSVPIQHFSHPKRAVYILGPEDGSLSQKVITKCVSTVQLPGTFCYNLAVAGSIVMYDRINKEPLVGKSRKIP